MPEESPQRHGVEVVKGTTDAPAFNPDPAVRRPRKLSTDAFVDGIRRGDAVVLSRAITLVESTRPEHREQAARILARCLPHTGSSIRIGITGVPGVGKSTFIESFGMHLIGAGHRVAVLAVDPSSERTKGSILGDKTRMPTLAAAPEAFVRPSPTSGSLGGVTRSTRESILLCEAAGFDVILVETVGVGQSEVAVEALVDFFLLLVLAGAGDELQAIKRGIMEMADAIYVTKADGPNADAARGAVRAYRNALRLYKPDPSGWRPVVGICSALDGTGIAEAWETIERYRAHAEANGYFEAQRRAQRKGALHRYLGDLLRQHFFAHPALKEHLHRLEASVGDGTMSPYEAARELVDRYTEAR